MNDMMKAFLAAAEHFTPRVGDKVYMKSNGHFLGRVKEVRLGYILCGSEITTYMVDDGDYILKK